MRCARTQHEYGGHSGNQCRNDFHLVMPFGEMVQCLFGCLEPSTGGDWISATTLRSITHGVNRHAYITLWPISRGPYVVARVSDHRSKPPLNETTRVFGERVRRRRVALGLSQEAAAVRCGIHWTQLGKVERGQRSLRLETIIKIADGLEVDAADLVSGLPLPTGGG
jgi:DNA-binding XRE family transcriptional regulator